MFDINGAEFLVIGVIALILIGPDRLPEYVRGLRNIVRRVRGVVKDGQAMLKDELGGDVDLTTFDPRQYDPRRIVRDALLEDDDLPDLSLKSIIGGGAVAAGASAPSSQTRRPSVVTAAGEDPTTVADAREAEGSQIETVAQRKARRARERRAAAKAAIAGATVAPGDASASTGAIEPSAAPHDPEST